MTWQKGTWGLGIWYNQNMNKTTVLCVAAAFAAQDGKIKIELPKGVAAVVFPICGAEKTQKEE